MEQVSSYGGNSWGIDFSSDGREIRSQRLDRAMATIGAKVDIGRIAELSAKRDQLLAMAA